MKHIVKESEPKEFTDWKNLANDDWQPDYKNNLGGDVKKALKTALMEEQGYICCYCERELTDDDSHIEHFRPQSDQAVDPLDFSNMICSCQNKLSKREPRHCGNLKGDWYDKSLLVSPFDIHCEERFEYTIDGYISHANGGRAASTTIDKLGLGIDKLNKLREMAIEPFLEESLSDEDLIDFAAGYLQHTNGRFNPFYTTIKYLFG